MNFHELVIQAKKLAYPGGEPYRLNEHTLRFIPGYRPVRAKYATSDNAVSRYDALEMELLRRSVRPGDFAVDVGAHAGQYAISMAALCGPEGRVVAFEPDPAARALLSRAIALNPHIKAPVVDTRAVSDSSGETLFFSQDGNSNSSLVAAENSEPVRVETCRLDDVVDDPDWVKIDTEGAEIRILKGAPRLLKSPANFLVELHPYAWDGFGNTFEELVEVVRESGRRMRYLDRAEPLVADPVYGVVVLER